MFRSAVATLCRFRGCLPRLQQGIENSVVATECRPLHLTRCVQVLHKDHPGKKVEKEPREQEVAAVEEGVEEQLQGLKFDSMFPTLETHSMLINNTRFDELPIIHIKATHNNTIIMVTDGKGVPLAHESGGTVGFRNARKGTNIAAQAAAIALAQKATKKGINLVRISVKGIGPGRLPAIKGLQMSGLTVVSITDATPLPFNGLRPKKQRRL
ncbi:small ribosomal subunit protein uS11-like [Babylonia areolata]|uniref:small ribosomal subunit protein uS11-like n=1 Tax=Babylonia areolata TaxID=304850 RepID=UPI003FD2DBFA